MEQKEWESLNAMQDRELLDFATETHGSQRMHAAAHILAMRRNRVMERVAMWSAIAAGLSFGVAFLQLFK